MKLNNTHLIQRMLIERSVVDSSGCWNWTWYKDINGYGKVTIDSKTWLAHRVSYIVFKGEFPDEMFICHHCDNPSCINPDHLRTGSHAENMAEARERGLIRSGDRHPQFGRKKPPGIKNRLSKPVRVLGKLYSSQKEAEAALGLGSGTVRYWVRKNQGKAELISRQEYESNA